MRTCLSMDCVNSVWHLDEVNYCVDCGEELCAVPTCTGCEKVLALKSVIANLRRGKKQFCEGCGQEWTSASLGKVLAGSVQGLLNQIVGRN